MVFEEILELNWDHLREHLRDERIEAKYKLREVGRALGTSPQHVSDFEQGRRDLTLKQFLKYLQILPSKRARHRVLEIGWR